MASSKSATNEHTKGWGETAAYIFTKVGEQSISTGYNCTKGLNRVQVQDTTVERDWTEYKYRVQLYKRIKQSTSKGYNCRKGLGRVQVQGTL